MRILIFHLIFLLSPLCAFAQNLMGSQWVIGSTRLMKATFSVQNLCNLDVFIDSSGTAAFPYYYTNGHSNICDSSTGKVLFSSSGMIIHDTSGEIMENGDSLVDPKIYSHNFYPNSPATQGSIILPKGSAGKYYIFTPTISDSAYTYYITNGGAGGAVPYDRLTYHIVDMNQNNGLGKVIEKKKILLQGVAIHKTMMQACRHSNGVDWWLLKQGEYDTNRIYRFLVKADTIEGPWIQNFAEPKYPSYDLKGQYAFSPDGKKFASIQGQGKMNKLFLADFDRCTGELNNYKIINIPIDSTTYPVLDINLGYLDSINGGVCFSPNGQFIYVVKEWNIYQYEHAQPDSQLAWYRVQHGPDTTFLQFALFMQAARGMDNRIYIGYVHGTAKEWSRIDNPDVKGVGCNFCRKCFRNDTISDFFRLHAPPNMPDYKLGAEPGPCWPVNSSEIPDMRYEMEVWPNPVSGRLYIKTTSKAPRELYNHLGQLLLSTREDEMDVRGLAAGMYYLKCGGVVRKVVVE